MKEVIFHELDFETSSLELVFEKEVILHEFDFETSDLDFEVSKLSIWKHKTSCNKGVFISFISRNFNDQYWAQIFTGLLFYEYVEIHQVGRLFFDNYQ